MKENIKNILAGVIVIALLVFSYAAIILANQYSKNIDPTSFRSFTVTGEGKANAVPDIAQFNFSIITQGGKDIAALQKENTEKSAKAVNFLKSSKIEDKDIKTQNYNVEPRYQYFDCSKFGGVCPPPEIVGYTITQSVLVKVRDFAKTGDILSGVVANGANSVSQLYFTIDNISDLQNKARTEAVAKAKEKAKNIADAGGFEMGRLLFIEEGFNVPPVPYYAKEGMGMGGDGMVPVQPGSQEVTVNITLKYEIK